MEKVVITGGAGFIGSHAAEYFADTSDQIILIDNLSRSKTLGLSGRNSLYNWRRLRKKYPNIKLLQHDVRNFAAIKKAAKGADLIIHAAAQVAVTTSIANPRRDFETNALGTINVLEAARLANSSIVFCSSNKVYGENVNSIAVVEKQTRYSFDNPGFSHGIPENFPVDHTSHSPYGSSKLAADTYVQDYAYTYGIKTGVFRMSCIYGEHQFGAEDQGWLAWFVIASLTGQPITIYGDGKQVRDVLYVEDLIKAFGQFSQSDLKHGVYNMGGGPSNTLSLRELIEIIKKATGRAPYLKYGPWRVADQKVYISDIRKAEESLRWKPATSPMEGVKHVINWVETNRELFS